MRKLTFRLQIATDCEEIHPLYGAKGGCMTGILETVDFEFRIGKGWFLSGESKELSAESPDEELNATILRYIAKGFGYDLKGPIEEVLQEERHREELLGDRVVGHRYFTTRIPSATSVSPTLNSLRVTPFSPPGCVRWIASACVSRAIPSR